MLIAILIFSVLMCAGLAITLAKLNDVELSVKLQLKNQLDTAIAIDELSADKGAQCNGRCQDCKVTAEFKLRGADLVAAARLNDYRNMRAL